MGKRIDAVRKKLAAWIAPSPELGIPAPIIATAVPPAPRAPEPSLPQLPIEPERQAAPRAPREPTEREAWKGHPHDRPAFRRKVAAAASRFEALAAERRKLAELVAAETADVVYGPHASTPADQPSPLVSDGPRTD